MWVLIGANHFHVTRKRVFDPRLDSRPIMVPSNSSIPQERPLTASFAGCAYPS